MEGADGRNAAKDESTVVEDKFIDTASAGVEDASKSDVRCCTTSILDTFYRMLQVPEHHSLGRHEQAKSQGRDCTHTHRNMLGVVGVKKAALSGEVAFT